MPSGPASLLDGVEAADSAGSASSRSLPHPGPDERDDDRDRQHPQPSTHPRSMARPATSDDRPDGCHRSSRSVGAGDGGDVMADGEAGGGGRARRVEDVGDRTVGDEREVVEQPARRGRRPGPGSRRRRPRGARRSRRGHIGAVGAGRGGATRPSPPPWRRDASTWRPSATCPGKSAISQASRRSNVYRRCTSRARCMIALGPADTVPSTCRVKWTPRNGKRGSGTG